MDEEESIFEVHTPTKSELATFQVLANMEFVNLSKVPDVEEIEEQPADVMIADDAPFLQEKTIESRAQDSEPSSREGSISHSRLQSQAESRTSSPKAHFFDREKPYDLENMSEKTSEDFEKFEKPSENFEKLNEKPSEKNSENAFEKTYEKAEKTYEKTYEKEKKYKQSTQTEIDAEKEGLLAELNALERQGHKLVRPLSMSDSLEEIQFQYDRIQAEINATQMVEFAKSSIKMGSGMVEMFMKKAGIKVVDGYHNNLCKDMNKFNRPLGRLYKKYWRRGGMSPEAELGMLVFGSLAWTVVQNKMGSASAFTGSDVPPPPQPEIRTQPAKPMRPPQMSSLNVPASWSAPIQPEKDEELQKIELARQKLEEKELATKRLLETLETRSAEMNRKNSEMLQQLEFRSQELERRSQELDRKASFLVDLEADKEAEKEAEAPLRKVTLHASPKKSAKKSSRPVDITEIDD